MEPDEIRHEDFADRIGERFEVVLDTEDGGAVTIELRLSAAILPSGDRPDHAHFVEWTGPPEPFLPQGIYGLRHDELGALDLFLVPVNEVDDGFVYEAVFTRLDG